VTACKTVGCQPEGFAALLDRAGRPGRASSAGSPQSKSLELRLSPL
jgi:hypothetical protein